MPSSRHALPPPDAPAAHAQGGRAHAPPVRPSIRRRRPAGDLARDEAGASEVVGFILVFGIISMMLVLGMIAFNKAQEDARRHVTDLRAQSIGTRVASLVVQTSLAAETQGPFVAVRFLVDLPDQIEGQSYQVFLEPAGLGYGGRVRVYVPAMDLEATAPLFAADAPTGIGICGGAAGTSASGGHLYVSFNVDDYAAQNCLFIEDAP